MDRRFSVTVYDVDGLSVIHRNVKSSELDDFILRIPNWYDAGEIEINNKWFYVDQLKDLVATKSVLTML